MMLFIEMLIINLFVFTLVKDWIFDYLNDDKESKDNWNWLGRLTTDSGGMVEWQYTHVAKYIFGLHCWVCFSFRIALLTQLLCLLVLKEFSILSILATYILVWLVQKMKS